jgi:hypothetical protein
MMDELIGKFEALATGLIDAAQTVLPWLIIPTVLLVGIALAVSPMFRKFATQYQGWFYGVAGGVVLVMWGPDIVPAMIDFFRG